MGIASSGSVSLIITSTLKSLLQLFSCRRTKNKHWSSKLLLRFHLSVKKKNSFQLCLYNSWGGNWPGWEFLSLFLSYGYLKVSSPPIQKLSWSWRQTDLRHFVGWPFGRCQRAVWRTRWFPSHLPKNVNRGSFMRRKKLSCLIVFLVVFFFFFPSSR